MIDNFSLFLFSACIALTVYRATRLEGGKNGKNGKNGKDSKKP